MNEQVRKFSCTKQQVQDILRAIEVLEPVVFLIREVEQKKQELQALRDRKKIMENNINSVSTTMILLKEKYDENFSKVDTMLSSLNKEQQKLISQEKVLVSTIEELNNMIYHEYIKYADSFIGIDEKLAMDVAGCNDDTWSIEKFLAMFLILFNNGLDCKKRNKIFYELLSSCRGNPSEEVKILDRSQGNQASIIAYIVEQCNTEY